MKTVLLNHALDHTKNASSGKFWLLAGALMLIANLFYIQINAAKIRQVEMAIEQLSHSKNKRASIQVSNKENKMNRDEVALVNAAIAEIVLPWTSIFQALEIVDRPEIKLMSVEPNSKKQVLRIDAVATDTDSMMRYVDALAQQKMLKSAALITQQSADINGQPALHFVAEAKW